MSVKLVSITHPSLEKEMTPEEFVVYIARVSNPSNQMNVETAPRLINYLIKHKHWSPFEFVDMTVEIVTRRSIAAQILRHKSFSFQEFCMSGESEIYFDLPGKVAEGKRQLHKIKLKDIYTKWNSKDAFGNELKERIKKMFVRVYDESSKTLTHSHIKDVFQTGVKPIFEIELYNGKKIRCTKEHKVLSENGFVSLEQGAGLHLVGNTAVITNKDFVIGTNGIPLYQTYDWLNEQKQKSIQSKTGLNGIATEAGVSYHTIRKWLKKNGLQFTKHEVSEYREIWNKGKFGYNTKPHSKETILKMKSNARRGSDSNLWKGGSDRTERKKIADWCNSIRTLKLIDYNYSCSMCGLSQRLELDHIKPVYSNPELAYEYQNIQVLCNSCHNEKHKIAGDKKYWSEKTNGNKMTVRWSKIKTVKYLGEEMTYDLEIDHESHNYVADGVIVHNSQRYSSATNIQEIELRKQAEKNRQSSAESYDPDWVGGVKLSDIVSGHFQASLNLYNEMIQAGIAREVARDILPLATETRMFMKGNIRSWIHYLEIRTADDTQKEHREIANGIRDVFTENFPNISEAIGWGT